MGLPVLVAGALGLALLAVGAVYLTVECQALPGFMGAVHGDSSPRTGLGVVFVALGLMALLGGLIPAWRRR
jgi:hypothetical protein